MFSTDVVKMLEKAGLMTIGQVARDAGVSTHTLRYYEKQGLLSATTRSGTGYRFYDAASVERLRFIRSAQTIGFTLEDIRGLLVFDREGGQCQAEVQAILERRVSEVEQKMNELERVRSTLGRALQQCRRSNGECAVLENLRPERS